MSAVTPEGRLKIADADIVSPTASPEMSTSRLEGMRSGVAWTAKLVNGCSTMPCS